MNDDQNGDREAEAAFGCLVGAMPIYLLFGAFLAGVIGYGPDNALGCVFFWPLYLAWELGKWLGGFGGAV